MFECKQVAALFRESVTDPVRVCSTARARPRPFAALLCAPVGERLHATAPQPGQGAPHGRG